MNYWFYGKNLLNHVDTGGLDTYGTASIGTVTAPTGAGTCVAAAGAALTAEGAITISVGLELAVAALMNVGDDIDNYQEVSDEGISG